MSNAVKKTAAATKNFVVKHKLAIAVTVTAAATVVVMDKLRGGALRDHVEFLEERNLSDDYVNWIAENANI
jgi:hypothetical protein